MENKIWNLPVNFFQVECSTNDEHIFFTRLARYCYRTDNYFKSRKQIESSSFTLIFLFVILNEKVFCSESCGYQVSFPTAQMLRDILSINDVCNDFIYQLPDSLIKKIESVLSKNLISEREKPCQ